ncbi:hypothetical protein I79_009641 [Cricetulus griseus]|uniref:Uncharacterized protein n=1 Tax=Cricetulus griseus TaxID=10029 RepID=G3HGB7_CRIGR|nr:hypothetical protein I79_009641 [Cricetulus griseus]ERE90806.1 hypothetical protein H671_1g1418 [Cricetulus griseus]
MPAWRGPQPPTARGVPRKAHRRPAVRSEPGSPLRERRTRPTHSGPSQARATSDRACALPTGRPGAAEGTGTATGDDSF